MCCAELSLQLGVFPSTIEQKKSLSAAQSISELHFKESPSVNKNAIFSR